MLSDLFGGTTAKTVKVLYFGTNPVCVVSLFNHFFMNIHAKLHPLCIII